jgi:DNA modification methylase
MSIQLHHGDCREIISALADGSVNAILVDPPYGTQELGDGYGRRQKWTQGGHESRLISNDTDLSMIQQAYPHFGRLVTNGWSAVFFHPRMAPQFIAATSGDDYFGMVVWDKKRAGLGFHIRYAHECIAIFKHGAPERPPDPLLSVMSGWVDTARHPHEKPVPVLCELIEWMTKPGDVVLDCFAGTASTAVACIQTGRSFIGCEINEDFYRIGLDRIAAAQAQQPLFAV